MTRVCREGISIQSWQNSDKFFFFVLYFTSRKYNVVPSAQQMKENLGRTGLGDPERHVVPSEKLKTMFLKALLVT